MIQQYDCDLIVVGCGVAGLTAAVSAAEQGLRVIAIERAPIEERGGQSRYTEAYLRMKSHSEVSDDFESHLADNGSAAMDPDLIEKSADANEKGLVRSLSLLDPNFIHEFAQNAGPTIQWFESIGAKFDFLPTQFLTKSQPRLLPVGGGQALIDVLFAQAQKLGVNILYECSAKELIENDQGKIIGLKARQVQQGLITLFGSVVLACGGFQGNAEMMSRYIGSRSIYLRPICKGGYFNRGEGIDMALKVGAATCGDFGSYHAEPIDPRSGMSEPSIFIFPYGILINLEGNRFTDEAIGTVDAHYESITRKIHLQSQGMAWVILDARHQRIPNYRLGIRSDQAPVVANTISDLSNKIKVPSEALNASVERYNQACSGTDWKPLELDGVKTQGLFPPKSNWACPIDEAPFHAYPIISANVFTFGGLKVDNHARVVHTDGNPIENLYAAGEIIGSYWNTYTGATSVLKGMVFGRKAGLDAAHHQKMKASKPS
jgi:tricarballylate dehydrogenase